MIEAAPFRLGQTEVEVCSIGEAEVLLDYPDALDAWLGEPERRALAGLRTPKRRRDWLAARIAAKRLIGRRLEALGRTLPTPQIQILNAPSREPFAALSGSTEPSPLLPISLAHAGDYGACALGQPGFRVGLDLERIEPRDPSWRSVMADDPELGPELLSSIEGLTRLWASKEAVLKLLGIGLSADARTVRPAPGGGVELSGRSRERWAELGSPRIQLFQARYHDCCLSVAQAALAAQLRPEVRA